MTKPIVSIIMSTYNNAAYITEAIDSVIKQSFTDWECIIINDASTDGTKKILTQYSQKDNRIHVYTNHVNKGLASNLNKGISIAKGLYIARIDGDDTWRDQNKLQRQVDFLDKNPEYGLIGSWACIIDKQGKKILDTRNPGTDTEIRNYLLIENCFFHSSVVIRKTIFDKAGGYDDTLQTTEDYNLWLKIGLLAKLYNMPEYMINYRVNPNGVNATRYTFQLQETIRLVKAFKNYYPNYSIGIFFWYLRRYVPQKMKTLVSNMSKNKYSLKTLRQIKKIILNFHPV